MKKFIVLILALNMYLGVFAQFTPGDTLKYRISLKDKAATDYSLQKPEMYLSKKSIERRKKQGLEIDSTDLPVCKKYVDAIRKKGVHVLVTGKWDNFVTVSCNDSMLIAEIAGLPFVRSTERVWRGVAKRASERKDFIKDSFFSSISIPPKSLLNYKTSLSIYIKGIRIINFYEIPNMNYIYFPLI